MIRRARLATLLGAGLVLASLGAVQAHHGWSGYDASKTLTLTGPISRVDHSNPHVAIDLSAEGKTWSVVLAPPWRMQNRGLPEGSLTVGATATVVGYAHKTETSELRAERITVAGKTVELR